MECIKLTYRTPVFGSVQCEELLNEDSRCIDFGPSTALRLYEKGPEVLRLVSENCEDLADCVPEELNNLVVKAEFGAALEERYSELYLHTVIYTRQEPTDFQHSQIINWITGQMSDGWGEGLEQKEVCSEELISRFPVFDETICEYEEEETRATAYYYIHPWANDATWLVDLVDSETVNLDIDEPSTDEELRQTVLRIKELIDQIAEELKNVT